ncbi:MAG: COG4280 domain-containing protein [Acidimicrobiales bacterium]
MLLGATVSSDVLVLVGAVFLASAVEMVEALTIVLAVGYTEGWRPALRGTATALVALSVLVAVLGPALIHVPLSLLRLVVGGVLLIFGLQWLRKAILRSSGLKAKHDEDAIFHQKVNELEGVASDAQRVRVAFVMAFKGVFLEGLEVVVLVITLGTSAHRLELAAFVALVAVVVVTFIGVIVARQLSKVPENAMKMAVGVMLVSYGTFWTGEGLKVHWPGGDTMLVVLVAIYLVVTWLLTAWLRVPRVQVDARASS